MLYDPVKTVRIEAATRLAGELTQYLDADQKELFQTVLQGVCGRDASIRQISLSPVTTSRTCMPNWTGRRMPSGNMRKRSGSTASSSRPRPTWLSLYNQSGQNEQAEQLVLKKALASRSQSCTNSLTPWACCWWKCGNTVRRSGYLEQASKGLPERPRIHYNLGLLYQHMHVDTKAEAELRAALLIEPQNLDFQFGLADYYLKRDRFEEARPIVEDMVSMHPENPIGSQMLNFIRQNTGR